MNSFFIEQFLKIDLYQLALIEQNYSVESQTATDKN